MSRTRSSELRPGRLFASLLGPLSAFVVFRQTLGNATEALVIAEALPVLGALAYGMSRRRIEPAVAIAATGFAVALLLTVALGGDALPLELHRALFPGAVGLACLISLVAGHPLLAIAAAKLAQARPETAPTARPRLDTPGARHSLAVLTAIIGVTMTADAATQVALAFTVSTSTFGVVARVASWGIIGIGLAVCALYARRMRGRR